MSAQPRPHHQRCLPNRDVSLSAEQVMLRSTLAGLVERRCAAVRDRPRSTSEFDQALWSQLVAIGAPLIAVPVEHGGGGGDLVDLVLVVEELGVVLTPVPIIEHAVAVSLLATHALADVKRALDSDDSITTLALLPLDTSQLVPAGRLASTILGLDGDALVAVSVTAPPTPDGGGLAAAALPPRDQWLERTTIAEGPAAHAGFDRALAQWRVLVAAANVGSARRALELAVEHAKHRQAFGVPIGSFQSVAHPLVDVAIAVEAARHLTWEAAWLLSTRPGVPREAVAQSRIFAARTASRAAEVAIHTLGGVGVTTESEAPLHLLRAKSWALVDGDPNAALDDLVPVGARS